MPSLRRGLRRAGAILAATCALLALTAMPANARTCTTTVGDVSVTTPCPGPQDQPVPAPVWFTTDTGPGFGNPYWSFIEVTQGARVFFANTLDRPERVHGEGFDTGIVPANVGAAEVAGVSSLPVGDYAMYDIFNKLSGWLHIRPSSICFECVTDDADDASVHVTTATP